MVNSKRSVFALMAVASSWLACGDLLDLGPRPEKWPSEGGLSDDIGSSDATTPVEASHEVSDEASAEASDEASNSPTVDPAINVPEAAALSAIDADVSFPAVGFVTGISSPVAATHPGAADWTNERTAASTLSCSGVLIASRTVLTVASCLASDPRQTYFALNPTGNALAHPDRTMVYAIDGVHLSPGGQAILHLAVASGQPEPASLATPIPVMTANDGMSSPFGIHVASPLQQVLEEGTSTSLTAIWRIEDGPRVVRRTRAGALMALGDGGLQFTTGQVSPASSSDLGAPTLAQNGTLVVGSLCQIAPTLSFLSTYSIDEGNWLEQMLWLYDEVVVPNVTLAPPPGIYSWTRVSSLPQDPAALQDAQPTVFYAAGSEPVTPTPGSSTRTLGICTTWTGGTQVPGKYWYNGGCAYDRNMNETWANVYKVLNLGSAASWAPANGGSLAMGSFAPGYDGLTPLFACRARYMNGIQPGVVRQGDCYFTWGGQELIYSTFETLVLGP